MDSFSKRERERRKVQKRLEKKARKQDRADGKGPESSDIDFDPSTERDLSNIPGAHPAPAPNNQRGPA
jgi:hypothetical protein